MGRHQSLFILDSRSDGFQGQGRGITCQDRFRPAKIFDSLEDILFESQVLGNGLGNEIGPCYGSFQVYRAGKAIKRRIDILAFR